MAHTHNHGPTRYGMAFAIGTILNMGFVIAEFIYGTRAHSLALVADAGHNLGDVLGLVLAWGASFLATRQPTQRRTYGYRRSTILASLINAIVLLVTVGGIAWEALRRLIVSETLTVGETTVIWVAAAGIVINTITALLFLSGRKEDLNIRSTFLHMASDAVISLGVVVAGIIMLFTNWLWLDPVVSLIIASLILVSTWGLLRESVNLALDAVPEDISAPTVQRYLTALPDVVSVHDLHIWGMSTTETALTAHLVLSDTKKQDALLSRISRELHDNYGIEHATIQVETGKLEHECSPCDEQVYRTNDQPAPNEHSLHH